MYLHFYIPWWIHKNGALLSVILKMRLLHEEHNLQLCYVTVKIYYLVLVAGLAVASPVSRTAYLRTGG